MTVQVPIYKGVAEIYIVKYGEDILIGSIDGKVFYREHITIVKGSVNHFKVKVELK